MRRVTARFVPPSAHTGPKRNIRLILCQELEKQIANDPDFLSKVFTGEESWCYGNDPETKQAWSQWKTSPPAQQGPPKRNIRLILCQKLEKQIKNDPDFLSNFFTGEERWCYGNDPETKQAWSQWKTSTSPRAEKVREVRSNVRMMPVVFISMFEES